MDNPHSRNSGIFTRLGLGLIGANRDRADWAGRDDQARFRLLAVSAMLLAGWIWFNVANALVIATDEGFSAPRVVVLASLIAGLYLVVDLSLLMARSWAVGVRMARERGFEPVATRGWAWIAALPFALLRLILAVSVALFAALSFGLWYWNKDISARLHDEQIAVNAPLRQRVEAELDRDLAAATAELGQIEARIAARAATAHRSAEQGARQGEAERNRLQSALDALPAREAAMDAQVACHARDVAAEERGLVGCDGVQRTAGQGGAWRKASAELALAQAGRAALAAERARVEAALAALPPPPVVAVTADPEQGRRDALEARRAGLIATRAETVTALMQADPAHVPASDGLLQRQQALADLAMEKGVVLFALLVTKVMFVALDFAVLAIAFGAGPASIYALRQVVELEVRAADEVAEGHTRLAGAATRIAAAEAARLQAELAMMQARRETRAEMRRMEITEDVLDRLSRGLGADESPRPRFDA